jgi:hypothetical protein
MMQFIFTTVLNVFITVLHFFTKAPSVLTTHPSFFFTYLQPSERSLLRTDTSRSAQIQQLSTARPLPPSPPTRPNPARVAPPAPPRPTRPAPASPPPSCSSAAHTPRQLHARTLSATSAASRSLRAASNIGTLRGGLLTCKENITFFTTHPSIFTTHPFIFTTTPLPVYVRKTVVRHQIPPEQRPLAPASH